jgi:N-acetylglucosamine transport system permease protein
VRDEGLQYRASGPLIRGKSNLLKRLLSQLAEIPYYIVLGGWAVFTIFTFVWLIYTSFKDNKELFADVWSLPKSLNLDNYRTAWVSAKMGAYFLNSVWIVGGAILLIIILSSLASYVLARRKFMGNAGILTVFIAGMGIPVQLLLVPLFMLLNSLNLINSLLGLILVYTAISLPFTIFLLIGFFRSLPTELEESAAMDGASEFTVFYKIMLPMAFPGIVTAIILNFINLWSEYLFAMVLISDQSKRSLSLGVYTLKNTMTYNADWTGMFAGVAILMIPAIIIFVLLSERITSGMTVGAVKG